MIMHRTLRRLVAAGLLGATATLGASTLASAHVTVKPDSTAAGSFSALTFRVPNESDTAGTVKLAVTLPQDEPFVYVSTRPVPGWTVATTEAALPTPVDVNGTTITKAIRTVTWTAVGGTQIRPGEYQDFSISAGPLPASGTVVVPATQTYSDGTVVAWDEKPASGGAEPEHPAPSFTVSPQEVAPANPPADSSTAAASVTDPVARALSGAALLVAVVAAVLTGLGLRRSSGTSGTGE